MALQYLDATTIPYQVVLREADGTYQGQWAQSNQINYAGGNVAPAPYALVIGSNGAQMGAMIQFNQIDWASCLPTPSAYSTDEEIMAYLSTLFTGQQGTLVPPAATSLAMFSTEPIQEIDLTTDAGTYYIPLNGHYLDSTGTAYTNEQANTPMSAIGVFTAAGMLVACEAYTASKSFQIELMVSNVASGLKVTIDSTGTKIATGADVEVDYGERVCLKMTVASGTGAAMVSCVTTTFTPA